MAKYEIKVLQGSIEAKSFRELISRLEEEQEVWANFPLVEAADLTVSDNVRANWARESASRINSVLSFWSSFNFEKYKNQKRAISEIVEELTSAIEQATSMPPYSGSHIGILCLTLSSNGQKNAAVALLAKVIGETKKVSAILRNQESDVASFRGFSDALYAAIYATEPVMLAATGKYDVSREVSIAERMVEQLGISITEIEEFKSRIQDDATNLEKALCDRFKNLHIKSVKSIRRRNTYSRKIEQERHEKFKSLMDTFNAHLRIKRPVQLWEERQEEHQEKSNNAWSYFTLGAAGFGILAIITASMFGDAIAETFVKKDCLKAIYQSCEGISAKGPLTISMILAVSTVWLWFLRLQMKIFLSERHLSLDARERRAFAETYLSLLKGSDVSREHEAVILQSLFRPTQDGLIKDDMGPDIGVAGMLAKILDKK